MLNLLQTTLQAADLDHLATQERHEPMQLEKLLDGIHHSVQMRNISEIGAYLQVKFSPAIWVGL